MDRMPEFEPGSDDARVAGLLRAEYSAPADAAYWEGLETRILSRIALHADTLELRPASWWSVLERWAVPGLAAAGLLFALAGIAWSRQQDAELVTAYEVFAEPPESDILPGAVNVVNAPRDGSSAREATFRYVLSH